VLATKFGHTMGEGQHDRGYSRKHIMDAVDASLRRLQTDYIDIYQTHIWDREANRDEMMDALHGVVAAGKVRYIGITDMPFWQFASSHLYAKYHRLTKFASVQNHYNLLWREDERELMAFCVAEGIGMIPYSPLARGFLLGGAARAAARPTERAATDEVTSRLYGRPADEAVIKSLAAVAQRLDKTPAQVALAWVLSRPGVTAALFGPTSVAHVADAVGALSLQLSDADRGELESHYLARPASRSGV
jgi:aryl-alcohol dehydrogenase (NADP+)